MRNTRVLGLVLMLSAAAIPRLTLAADTYSCHTLDVPGGAEISLWRLNNSGQIAANAASGAFIYQSSTGTWTPVPAPPASTGFTTPNVAIEDINDSGTIVGSAVNATYPGGLGFILTSIRGTYDFIPLYLDDTHTNVYEEFRGVGDNGLVTAFAEDVNGVTTGLIYNPTTSAIGEFGPGYTPVVPQLSNGAQSINTIMGGMNTAGSFVGSGLFVSGDDYLTQSFLFNSSTSKYVLLPGANSYHLRGINDLDPNSAANCKSADCIRLAGFGSPDTNSDSTVGFFVDFDPTHGFQTPTIVDCGTSIPANALIYFEGINNHNVISGFYTDANGTNSHGLIAYPNVEFPRALVDGAFTFKFAVSADTAVFIDPAIASGYTYATGAGNPNFKSVTLPVGIGANNTYSLIIDGYGFSLPAGKRFDFTESGFPGGVASFTVIGIDSSAAVSTTNAVTFVTEVSFLAGGEFAGSMTPLTIETQDKNGGATSCADLDAIKAAFGKKRGQPGFNPVADTNEDGVINGLDLCFAAKLVPPGTVCK